MTNPSPNPSPLPRFAIVGAGGIGIHHGRVMSQLSDRLELVAVVDVDLARAETLAAQRGGAAYGSLATALAEQDIDVVVVCTPTGRHGSVAIEALEAGKHVIIEKPAEITPEKTDEIIAAQQRAGTLATVISQHRFDPSTEAVLGAIARGELGRITSGIASIDWWRSQGYYDSGEWRGTWELDGGGSMMNQGVHTVDLLVVALGNPVEVFAYTGLLAHERIETEDVATAVIRFESGALGMVHASTAAYPGLSARLQVHGDRGSAVIDDDRLSYIHVTPDGSAPDESDAGNQLEQYADARQRPGPALRRPPVAVSQRPRGAGRHGDVAGGPHREPALHRRHHRRLRVGAHRAAGRAVSRLGVSLARVAVNPIPYWNRGGTTNKSKEVFDEAFRDLAEIGYTAVKADIPEGMDASDYLAWIGDYGLAPALSLFSSPFDESVDLDAEVERAKHYAADQVSLGLDRTMVSSMGLPARAARPAVGAGFDADRLARAIDACGQVCEVLRAGGLRPLHHSHVGGVFETEDEIVRLLETLGPDVIGVGPDTGHLRWAGIDPGAFVRRYADRVGGIHLKDCFADHLGHDEGLGYHDVQATKRLWAEPGLGVVDFDDVLAAMPDGYDGDLMIEIDEPSVESLVESHRMAFVWAQEAQAALRGR